MNEIVKYLCKILFSADDTLDDTIVFIPGDNIQHMTGNINADLELLHYNKMRININKCKVMIIYFEKNKCGK